MSTAFAIAMIAVAISLGVVLMGVQANKAKKPDKREGGDSSASASADSSAADCSPGDGGGCSGGD